MNNSHPHTQKPTDKQLRYLRDLAASRGQSFTPPSTRGEASAEIERLKTARPSTRAEHKAEVFAYSHGVADRWFSATAVRDDEIDGYGSSARWK